MTEQTMDEIRKLSEPLVKYLNENYHPYVKIEISNSAISVFEKTTHIPIEFDKVKE